MAKTKYLALSNDIINSGLLIMSENDDDDDDNYNYNDVDSHSDDDRDMEQTDNKNNDEVIQILDLTNIDDDDDKNKNKNRKRKRQKLNKIKIVKLKKDKLNERVSIKQKKKKKRNKRINKRSQGIEVYGIDAGDIFYINDIVNIKWKLNRCIIYDEEEEEEDNNLNEKQFNIYLECKNYLCAMDGKVDIEIDKILLESHVSLTPNINNEYEYNVELPISFLHYDLNQQKGLQQAICYIRIVFINNDYYFYRLNGTSNIFELRNKEQINFDQFTDDDDEDDDDDDDDDDTQHDETKDNNKDAENKEKKKNQEIKKKKLNSKTIQKLMQMKKYKNDNGAWCICGCIK